MDITEETNCDCIEEYVNQPFEEIDIYELLSFISLPIREDLHDLTDDIDKIIATIKSCETVSHLQSSSDMILNFHNFHLCEDLTDLLLSYLIDKDKSLYSSAAN